MNILELISANKQSSVTIDKGELISYIINSEEIIHQKGNPGWRNSDTEMFPLIGATSLNNFTVSTPRGDCKQDQHGLLRELEYTASNQTNTSASFQKKYLKNTLVKNSKYPDKSSVEFVSWPYDFKFNKHFKLSENGLQITFSITAEQGMPFMLGYHPAFKLNGNKTEIIKTASSKITIDQILTIGSGAFPVLNTEEITLIKKNGLNVEIKTKGFQNFMLWTEVNNMLCIEPITFYPNLTKECLAKEMFRKANVIENFEVLITPIQRT